MSSLASKCIVVTRSLSQSQTLVSCIEEAGATAFSYPCIEITFEPLPDINLQAFDWLLLTSQNNAQAFAQINLPQSLQIARIDAQRAPNSASLAGMFESMPPQRILLPQSNLADDSLQQALKASGHAVKRILSYTTQAAQSDIDLSKHSIDAVTFTSPSTVKFFLERAPNFLTVPVACIGTTTYKAALASGFQKVICAKEPSPSGLVQILEEYFA
ncbi:MAG: uroporphyrinogen-III synthase [Myxococcota bacterium]